MLTSHRRRNDAPLQRQAVVPFGSGRNPGMAGNQRVNSLSGLCRSQHQVQVGASHGESRSSLTNRPASGNWCRTQGGMTELPPATESQAMAYAKPHPLCFASAKIRSRCETQVFLSSKRTIAARASSSVGRSAWRIEAKKAFSPDRGSSTVVSQCQAAR